MLTYYLIIISKFLIPCCRFTLTVRTSTTQRNIDGRYTNTLQDLTTTTGPADVSVLAKYTNHMPWILILDILSHTAGLDLKDYAG